MNGRQWVEVLEVLEVIVHVGEQIVVERFEAQHDTTDSQGTTWTT